MDGCFNKVGPHSSLQHSILSKMVICFNKLGMLLWYVKKKKALLTENDELYFFTIIFKENCTKMLIWLTFSLSWFCTNYILVHDDFFM